MKLSKGLVLGFIVTSNIAISQSSAPLRWFGDVRVRSELDTRDFNLRTPANTYTLLRTRFGVEASPAEDARVLVQARDSRVFGQGLNTLTDTRNLDLHQAFLEVKNVFTPELTLKVGRMELAYGNERMIGAVGWHNVGRVFDGGLLRLTSGSHTIDVLAATLAEVQSYAPVATPAAVKSTPDHGSKLFGAYATLDLINGCRSDAYLLFHWDRKQSVSGHDDLRRYTLGSYAKGETGIFDYEGEVAYQIGKRRGIDVEAYLFAAGVGYSFEKSVLSRLGIGYEILSGTSQPGAKYNSFDSPSHTGHKFYGFMDYFISVPEQTNNRGLVDVLVRATLSLREDLTANVWLHHFSYAESQNGEKNLGQEVDVVALYRHSKSLSFELGVSAFLPDHLMRVQFGGADVALWCYLTASVVF